MLRGLDIEIKEEEEEENVAGYGGWWGGERGKNKKDVEKRE